MAVAWPLYAIGAVRAIFLTRGRSVSKGFHYGWGEKRAAYLWVMAMKGLPTERENAR